ncbi:uncharacterized protein [Procambarus clarkii]|uniref:uncharacterized protein n=1 Tax=Procambarus clarkii TaxID=6728 RepID=UPI001E673AA0|nr:uncharacterized protein LOC123747842 [Procambarus clarkii]
MVDACPVCNRYYTRSRIPMVGSWGNACRECIIKQQQSQFPECGASRPTTTTSDPSTVASGRRELSKGNAPRTLAAQETPDITLVDACPECNRYYTRSRIPMVRSWGHACRECIIKQQQSQFPECGASRPTTSDPSSVASGRRELSKGDAPRTLAGNSQRQTGIPVIKESRKSVDYQGLVNARLPGHIPHTHLRQLRPPEVHRVTPSTDPSHGLQPGAKTGTVRRQGREEQLPEEDNIATHPPN